MGSTTEKIFLDIKIKGDKQLKQVEKLMQSIAKEIGDFKKAGKGTIDLQKELDRLIDIQNELRKVKEKESKETFAFGIKKLQFSKLELQKQKELLKQESARAKASDRERQKAERAATKEAERLEAEAELLSKQAETYEELAKQTSILTKQRKKLNLTTEEGQKEFQRLTDVLAQNNADLKEFDGQIGSFQRNVGDYKNQIGELIPAVGDFGDMLTSVAANPFFLVIGIAVTAIAALFNAFKKTERGAKLFAIGTGLIEAAMSGLVKVANTLADFLVKAWNEPIEALKDLGNAIEENFKRRIEAAVGTFKSFISIVGNVLSGNLDKAGESAKNFGKNLFEATTGIDTDKVEELTNELIAQAEAFAKLELAKLNQIKINRQLELQIADLTQSQELLTQVADDSTRSLIEQQKANKELEKSTVELAAAQVQLATGNLSLLNKEIALRKANGEAVSDLLDQRKDAIIAAKEAETEYLKTVEENAIRQRQILSDLAEIRLDALVDDTDARLRQNERIALSDKTTAEERKRLLDENTRLSKQALVDQVATLQDFAKQRIDIEQLINTENSALLDERIKALGLSEALSLRLLNDVVREQRTVRQDLAEFEEDINKKSLDQAKERFDKEQELAKAVFESEKRTAKEKEQFEITQEAEKLAKLLQLNLDYNQEISELDRQLTQQKIDNLNKELEKSQENEEQKKELVNAGAEALNLAFQAVSNANQANLDKQLSALEEQRKQGLITDKQFEKKSEDLKKEAARKDQQIAITQAIVNTALAVTKALGSAPPPFNVVLAGLAAAAGAVQVGTIKSQKFSRGGQLRGATHGQGGIDLGNGQEGENKEIIVNARSSEKFKDELSAINSYNGWGDPISGANSYQPAKFARGGEITTGVTPARDQQIQREPEVVIKYIAVLNVDTVTEYQKDRAIETQIQEGQ